MTYRTDKDKRRALYLLGAVATACIAALAILGTSDALETCKTVQSASTCLYALR